MLIKVFIRLVLCLFLIVLPITHYTNKSITTIRFEDIVNDLDSPERVWKYLKKFDYQTDRGIKLEPSIKSPQLFLNHMKGDCKDFSNFAFQIGQIHSVHCRVYGIYPKPMATGHAICIWKIKGKYYPLCNVTSSKRILVVFDDLDSCWKWYQKEFKWKELSYTQRVYPTSYFLIPMLDSCNIISDRFF